MIQTAKHVLVAQHNSNEQLNTTSSTTNTTSSNSTTSTSGATASSDALVWTDSSTVQTSTACGAFWKKEPITLLPAWILSHATTVHHLTGIAFRIRSVPFHSWYLAPSALDAQSTAWAGQDSSFLSVQMTTIESAGVFITLQDLWTKVWAVDPTHVIQELPSHVSPSNILVCLIPDSVTKVPTVALVCENVAATFVPQVFPAPSSSSNTSSSSTRALASPVTLTLTLVPLLPGGCWYNSPSSVNATSSANVTCFCSTTQPTPPWYTLCGSTKQPALFGMWSNAKHSSNIVPPLAQAVQFVPQSPAHCTLSPEHAQHHASKTTQASKNTAQTQRIQEYVLYAGVGVAALLLMLVLWQGFVVMRVKHKINDANLQRQLWQAVHPRSTSMPTSAPGLA